MCTYKPLKLVLATTDTALYDIDKKVWRWDGPLFWSVQCLVNKQTTISHALVPKLNKDSYLEISNSPTEWDYCLSRGCNSDSESMHIIFTFKPQSSDPNDYLQFVTDIYCHVTDFPQNFITDNSGKSWYINIVEVSKSMRENYVEMWIAQDHPQNVLEITPFDLIVPETHTPDHTSEKDSSALIVILVITILVVMAAIFAVMIIFGSVDKKKESNIVRFG